MNSAKQDVLCLLLAKGFTILRGLLGSIGQGPKYKNVWWVCCHHRTYYYGFVLADLLHKVHVSITEPDYVENDISFVNLAIPNFLWEAGTEVDPEIVKLLVDFHDGVPEELKKQLTWNPTAAHRQIASDISRALLSRPCVNQ